MPPDPYGSGSRRLARCSPRSARHDSFKLHPPTVEAGLARNPGVVATAMHCVNAVPYVCAAAPGVATYLDLPLVAGRAAPRRPAG